MRIKKTHALAGTLVASIAATAAFAMPSLAQNDPVLVDDPTPTTAVEVSPVDEGPGLSVECEALFDEWDAQFDDWEADFDDWELTEADIEEINAETDALIAFLDRNGIAVQIETDEDGLRFPVIEEAIEDLNDEEIDDLLNQFFDEYDEAFADEDFGDFDDLGELGPDVDEELLEQCEAEIEADFDAFIGELEGCEDLLGDLGDHFDEEGDHDGDVVDSETAGS